jgi:tRNA threonylcarbamoyl adenosine modification protein YeaZ
MQILSFDTSSRDVQIALMQDGLIVLEESISPPVHSRQESASVLLPSIDAALKKLTWRKSDLDFIVVGVGPGSFTGVRVAVMAARTIGQALALGVLPVCRLEVLALASARPCAVVLNAGAGKYYMGVYGEDLSLESAAQLQQPVCAGQAELQSRLARFQNWVLEPGLSERFLADGRTVYAPEVNLASAGVRLAFKRIFNSATNVKRSALAEAFPWDNVLPLYLQSPSVTLKVKHGTSDKTNGGG